jgi:hypothetical protein
MLNWIAGQGQRPHTTRHNRTGNSHKTRLDESFTRYKKDQQLRDTIDEQRRVIDMIARELDRDSQSIQQMTSDYITGKSKPDSENYKRRNTLIFEKSLKTRNDRKSNIQKKNDRRFRKLSVSDINWRGKFESGEQIDNLYAIVVPAGCGKTTMCGKMGWIDVDNCIPDRDRGDMWDERLTRLADGYSWSQSQDAYLNKVKSTLSLLSFNKPTVILVHDYYAVSKLGLTYLGGVFMEEVTSKSKRCGSEGNFATLNKELVKQYEGILQASDHNEVEKFCIQMCENAGIPTATPYAHGLQGSNFFTAPEGLGDGSLCDIDELISYEKQGMVCKDSVDYQVRCRGKGTYKGYGRTMDDWAKLMAKIEIRQPTSKTFSIKHSDSKAVTLDEIARELECASDPDVQEILECHKGDSVEFVGNLIMHWKLLGIETTIPEVLFKLYMVPEVAWNSMAFSLVSLVSQTEEVMGNYISPSDRKVILGMRFIGCTSMKQASNMIYKTNDHIVKQVGLAESQSYRAINMVLEEVKTDDLNHNSSPLIVSGVETLMVNSVFDTLLKAREKGAADSLSVMKMEGQTLRNRICVALLLALPEKWRFSGFGEGQIIRHLKRGLHTIALSLSSRQYIKDEWTEAIKRVLDSESNDFSQIGHMLYKMMISDFCTSCVDRDWDVKLMDSAKSLTVAGLCAVQLGKTVKLFGSSDQVPVVWDCSQTEIGDTLVRLNLPKHMCKAYGDELNEEVFLAQCIRTMMTDESLQVVQAVSSGWMLGSSYTNSDRIASLGNMLHSKNSLTSWKKKVLFDILFRHWYGREAKESDEQRVINITFSKTSQKGIGCSMIDKTMLTLDKNVRYAECEKDSLRDGKGRQDISLKANNKIKKTGFVKVRWHTGSFSSVKSITSTVNSNWERKNNWDSRLIGEFGITAGILVNELQEKAAWKYGVKQSQDMCKEWRYYIRTLYD